MKTRFELFEIAKFDLNTIGKRLDTETLDKIRNTYFVLNAGEAFVVPKNICGSSLIKKEFNMEIQRKEVRVLPVGAKSFNKGNTGARIVKLK